MTAQISSRRRPRRPPKERDRIVEARDAHPARPSAQPGDELAGYRVVRRLPSSLGDDRFVAVRASSPASDDAESDDRTLYSVLLVAAPRSETPSARDTVAARLAVGAVMHDNVVPIVDLGHSRSHDVVVVTPVVPAHTLASLTLLRGSWRLGELVTALAPVVSALRACHAAGVHHGSLDAEAISIDASGKPWLENFGASEVGLDVARSRAAATADVTALRSIVDRAAGLLEPADARRWKAALASAPPPAAEPDGCDRALALLEEALYSVADALPIDQADDLDGRHRTGAMVDGLDPFRAADPAASDAPTAAPSGADRERLSRRAAVLEERRRRAGAAKRIRSFIRRQPRRRFVLAGVGSLLLVIVGAALSASPSDRAISIPTAPVVSAAPDANASSVGAAGGSEETDAPAGPPTTEAAAEPPGQEGTAQQQAHTTTDPDPVVAFDALTSSLRACTSAPEACVDAVTTVDSALRADDSALVSILAGETTARLVGREGGVALIDVAPVDSATPETATASVLVVRTEAGWLLRQAFIRTPGTP